MIFYWFFLRVKLLFIHYGVFFFDGQVTLYHVNHNNNESLSTCNYSADPWTLTELCIVNRNNITEAMSTSAIIILFSHRSAKCINRIRRCKKSCITQTFLLNEMVVFFTIHLRITISIVILIIPFYPMASLQNVFQCMYYRNFLFNENVFLII